jgi:hypothetical protein
MIVGSELVKITEILTNYPLIIGLRSRNREHGRRDPSR